MTNAFLREQLVLRFDGQPDMRQLPPWETVHQNHLWLLWPAVALPYRHNSVQRICQRESVVWCHACLWWLSQFIVLETDWTYPFITSHDIWHHIGQCRERLWVDTLRGAIQIFDYIWYITFDLPAKLDNKNYQINCIWKMLKMYVQATVKESLKRADHLTKNVLYKLQSSIYINQRPVSSLTKLEVSRHLQNRSSRRRREEQSLKLALWQPRVWRKVP